MEYFRIYPDKMYEEASGTLVVKTIYKSLNAATNNQLIITAVTGKKLIAICGSITSLGAATNLALLSASGGAVLKYLTIPANTVAEPNVNLPFNVAGWFATNSGEGLYANCGAVEINLDFRYIEVTA